MDKNTRQIVIFLILLCITPIAYIQYNIYKKEQKYKDLNEFPCQPPICTPKERIICQENIKPKKPKEDDRYTDEKICKTEKTKLIWTYNHCLKYESDCGEWNEPIVLCSVIVECYDINGNVLPNIKSMDPTYASSIYQRH